MSEAPVGQKPPESPSSTLTFLKGRWIDGWNPEDVDQWENQGGEKIAKRNLIFSIFVEHLGFVTWGLWAIVAVQLQVAKDGTPGPFGFAFTSSQVFWLISLPSLIGATLRFPYTFMVAKLGGRNWTIVSGTLLLIPTTCLALAIGNHPVNGVGGTSFGVMALVASLAGFGGGNFASSMANITFFYPQRRKGWALGMNAAGGNIGQAVIQFFVPIIISVFAFTAVGGLTPNAKTHKIINLPAAGYFWIPFILAAVVCAFLFMNNLTSAKSDSTGYVAALKEPHNWILSFLYIGTFGSFIGLSGAFPKLINDNFHTYSTIQLGAVGVGLSFLGPLVGSLIRPFGGWLADRLGGAYVTTAAFIVMIASTLASIMVIRATITHELTKFVLFLICFMVLFAATGTGNGSMYKMIPTVYNELAGQVDAQHKSAGIAVERKISASLGIVSAIGAYGGFLIPQVFNKAVTLKEHTLGVPTGNAAAITPGYTMGLWWLFGAYIVFLLVHIAIYIVPYARRGVKV